MPRAKVKTIRVPDTRGRLDVLAKGVISRVVEKSGNPVAQEMLRTYSADVENVIEHFFAPRDKRGRIKPVPMVRVPVNSGGEAA